MATEQELSDFLKSVEKRAFKRSLYHVRNEEAALDIVQATRDCILDLVGPHAHPTAQAGVDSVDVVLGAHLSAARGGARVALPLSGADLDLDVSIT